MTCAKCGVPLTEADKFCGKCGAPANAGSVPHMSPPPVAANRVASQPLPSASVQKSAAIKLVAITAVLLLIVVGVMQFSQNSRRKAQLAQQAAAKKKADEFLRNLSAQSSSNQQTPANSQDPSANLNALLNQVQSAVQTGQQQSAQAGDASPSAGSTAPNASSTSSAQPALPPAPSVPGPGAIEHTVDGAEADLLVRTGYIDNLGFGWPPGFDVFAGKSTPSHAYPWNPPAGAPEGTDRILLASVVTYEDRSNHGTDGYSSVLNDCCGPIKFGPAAAKGRQPFDPVPITLDVSGLPSKIDAVLVQIFVDDFQAPYLHSRFQVSLNDTRIPQIEDVINALDQTGPIGKLISVKLLPEFWPLLKSGTVKLLIDDPTTHVPDGYAIGFVRILVNPHAFKYVVSLTCTVTDSDTGKAISGANVTAAVASTSADKDGKCAMADLPAGLVVASASAPGYDPDMKSADLAAGEKGNLAFRLHPHQESTAALERAIAETGTAKIYGIHFDTGSAKLRGDSLPALNAVLGLINNHAGSKWQIAGHTDNQGNADSNQKLSEARAKSVVGWLTGHGIAAPQLVPEGFGQNKPVADNATANGRALNRRVEVAPAK